MINDITFGQYFPMNSFIHKLDPRFKILLTLGMIVVAFVAQNYVGLGIVLVFTVLLMITSKIPIKMYLKTFKSIWVFVLLTALLNVFYVGGGKLLCEFWVFHIYSGGLERAGFIALRVLLLIIISAALTYTTSPTDLTDAIESLLKPLTLLKVDTHTFAMMMTIALRFIPTLIEETGKIMNAQKARGASMDTGSLIQKIKSVLPILIPLLASSIRRATELADAMECRCYHGGKGRTRLKVLKFSYRDVIATLLCALLLAVVILLNIIL